MQLPNRMVSLLTNPNFLVIVAFTGGIVGFFNCVISQLQQIACSSGYTDTITGAGIITCLVSGLFGGVFASYLSRRTGKTEELAKVRYVLSYCIYVRLIRLSDSTRVPR